MADATTTNLSLTKPEVGIYNRALSSTEIAANYARDKIVLAGRGISLP